MSKKLRVAVIGAGNMGRHHIRNYFEMPEVELVAFADPNLLSAEFAEKYDAKHFRDYSTMISECEIEAVSIVVPTPLHFEIAMATMNKGIHTLLEKPIASTVSQAKELIAKSQEMGVTFTIGHIERYNPIVQSLKELVVSGRLGHVSSIVSQRLGGFPTNEPKSDVILDLAIHDIDIFNYLTGANGEIIGVHGSRTFHSKEVDSAEILLKHRGASGFIQANWVTPVKIRRITITGSNGFVEADYITQEIKFYDSNVSQGLATFEEFVKQFSNPDTLVLNVNKYEPLKRELSSFIEAANGGTPELLVDSNDALQALESALKAGSSIKDLELVSHG